MSSAQFRRSIPGEGTLPWRAWDGKSRYEPIHRSDDTKPSTVEDES